MGWIGSTVYSLTPAYLRLIGALHHGRKLGRTSAETFDGTLLDQAEKGADVTNYENIPWCKSWPSWKLNKPIAIA